jgi:hypothetical protein
MVGRSAYAEIITPNNIGWEKKLSKSDISLISAAWQLSLQDNRHIGVVFAERSPSPENPFGRLSVVAPRAVPRKAAGRTLSAS